MANALDAVLELKARESADRKAQADSIMNAMQLFQNARQQQFQRQLASMGLEIEQRKNEAEGQRESQKIENERLRQAQEKRKQDIELVRYGLKDTGVGISEDPSSMYQKNLLSEINARKANETIAALMKGHQMEQIGINMQKDAFDLEDDSAYARGQQIRQLGQNISANAVIPEDQTVNGYLDPKTADNMPKVPLEPLAVPTSNEGKSIRQMKEEKSARKIEFEADKAEAVANKKEISSARKAFDLYQSDANQVLVAIDKLENQAKNLPNYKRGIYNQATGRISASIKEFSKDKNISRYQGVVAQELIPLARRLMEEKGPITEWDVARVEKGLGDITLPLEDKQFLFNEMRDKIRQALKVKKSIANISDEEMKERYSDVWNKAFSNKPSGLSPEKKARLEELRKKRGE